MNQLARTHLSDPIATQLERLDDRFADVNGDEWIERPFRAGRWLEGPAYFPASRYLVLSDIPDDRVLRFDPLTDTTAVFTHASGHANGHTIDRAGRLLTCEQSGRRVTRTEHDGSVTVLADRYRNRRLNSPNDVVEHSGGSVWFTDPSYGIDSDYEGVRAEQEQDGCHVFRVEPDGRVTLAASDFERPNGLAFSPDESRLYVVDTRRRHLRAFDVNDDLGLIGGDVVAECTAGSFDGIRVDSRGRVWAAAHDGLHCFSPAGDLLGKLLLPEIVSNLTFAGPGRNHLYITATSTLYSWRSTVTGLPFR